MRDGEGASKEISGLPFDDDQQAALVGHVMANENFFRQVKDRVDPKWFNNPATQAVYDSYIKFFERYGAVPRSSDDFVKSDDVLAMDQLKREKFRKAEVACRAKKDLYLLQHLSGQLTTWMKAQIFFRDLPKVADHLNARKVDDAEKLIDISTREILRARFDISASRPWADWRNLRELTRLEVQGALTTGLEILNRKILPEGGGKGCLVPGDTTVIIAPTNAGKTSAMITMAVANVKEGKDVLVITREGRESDIQQKLWQCMFQKTREDLWSGSYSPQIAEYMDKLAQYMDRHLTYVSMTKPGMEVEECVGQILTMQANHKANHGKGFDLVVVDYPGIFTAAAAKGARWEWRQQQDYIYRQFVQLALDEKFHCLVAAQTNREGYKLNRNDQNSYLLGMEYISEAFAIAFSATNVLTLNRNLQAQAENRITWYYVKGRGSETGWAVACRSDYARCITHGDHLGATAYRNNGIHDEVIDSLIKTYPNQEAPENQLVGETKVSVERKKRP